MFSLDTRGCSWELLLTLLFAKSSLEKVACLKLLSFSGSLASVLSVLGPSSQVWAICQESGGCRAMDADQPGQGLLPEATNHTLGVLRRAHISDVVTNGWFSFLPWISSGIKACD